MELGFGLLLSKTDLYSHMSCAHLIFIILLSHHTYVRLKPPSLSALKMLTNKSLVFFGITVYVFIFRPSCINITHIYTHTRCVYNHIVAFCKGLYMMPYRYEVCIHISFSYQLLYPVLK